MDTRLSKRFGIIGVSWPQNEKVTLNCHCFFSKMVAVLGEELLNRP